MASPPFTPDETKPADADIVSQYPAVERLFRDIVESWLLIDHDTNGQHKLVALIEQASDPGAETNIGKVYTKDDAGDTELFYRDDGGTVMQLTRDGAAGPGLAAFPAGTSMLFYQSAAPTGWTKDVAATLNNHAIRVVTSTAWSTGSNGATAFTSVFGSGKTAGATTLTAAQSGLPSHVHVISARADSLLGANSFLGRVRTSDGTVNDMSTDAVSGASASSGHTHTLSLDLNFINVIRATKD